eukprot:TRINITY_DN4939_c0_g1_i3.p1 TRINITY_DN4939_c0_g1~~TRINITY_DN4939_c0_g1_i3.p1  ORF type:complete len:501 (-),score=127.23 TRINITY_DN4939_c0_g1_i3:42-1544(-)
MIQRIVKAQIAKRKEEEQRVAQEELQRRRDEAEQVPAYAPVTLLKQESQEENREEVALVEKLEETTRSRGLSLTPGAEEYERHDEGVADHLAQQGLTWLLHQPRWFSEQHKLSPPPTPRSPRRSPTPPSPVPVLAQPVQRADGAVLVLRKGEDEYASESEEEEVTDSQWGCEVVTVIEWDNPRSRSGGSSLVVTPREPISREPIPRRELGQAGLAQLREGVILGAGVQEYAQSLLDEKQAEREKGRAGLGSLRHAVVVGAGVQEYARQLQAEAEDEQVAAEADRIVAVEEAEKQVAAEAAVQREAAEAATAQRSAALSGFGAMRERVVAGAGIEEYAQREYQSKTLGELRLKNADERTEVDKLLSMASASASPELPGLSDYSPYTSPSKGDGCTRLHWDGGRYIWVADTAHSTPPPHGGNRLPMWSDYKDSQEQSEALLSVGLDGQALEVLRLEHLCSPVNRHLFLRDYEARWLHAQGRFDEAVLVSSPTRTQTPCTGLA